MPESGVIDERCAYSLTEISPEVIESPCTPLEEATQENLWEICEAIGSFWSFDRVADYKSAWLEFMNSKTMEEPSYFGEYGNAVAVIQELKSVYGEQAFEMLLFRHGISGGSLNSRLAHAKRYVVDEFIRVLVISGGFRSFLDLRDDEPANYRGHVGGSRYRRLQTVRFR